MAGGQFRFELAPADTKIHFFSKSFLIHSSLLKAHSKVFRKLCDADDKEYTGNSSYFRYEWNMMVNPRGVWRLGSIHTAPSAIEWETYKDEAGNGRVEMETGFDRLMHVFHGHPFRFAEFVLHMNYMVPIVEIAQVMEAIPAVTSLITQEICRRDSDHCRKMIERMVADTRFALNVLEISTQLKIPELFKDALTICIGPYHNPLITRELDQNINEAAREATKAVLEELQTREHNLQADLEAWMQKDYDLYVGAMELPSDEIRTSTDKAKATLLKEDRDRPMATRVGGIPKPAYYRRISKVATPKYPGFLKTITGPMLENKLSMYPAARAGEGIFKHYFLCPRIDDSQLPWFDDAENENNIEAK